ncbi:GPP34 family phosphoprotein [Streptomyces lunaelactis]|uniref:GOLPH3/VPS74 family protein n=1 Tax=Streptomyces lunaelactis TaxID=1535768 RepID=UPI0015859C8F|nr:GPP34 family phosphoprotein [Streptomyces lunaelactis]NUK02117.1 GPP34 family phosphoprotein [Streptomyces lunaelactis]NUK16099.1 GPP34 family phosphoprotein [Streptomyces lunaelactis]NUK23389.1 GPP34 family phosphoprotein [Streptomyces lunaelactis]NUK34921.1 GPP34 family phosphoprotein [Streptomyces lunaelactis]NUK41693.1 GPP34 family phosphoprotein [Streptomyces lunaelactis]
MTTPRDLLIVTMDVASGRPVEQGDLSLALAGAELVDLVDAEALTLDGDRIVPGPPSAVADRLLHDAASSLSRQAPYESVEEWLWRRGRGLSSTYLADLEAEGQVTRQRHRWIPLRTDGTALVDSPARRQAAARWTSGEPVLAALAAATGIHEPTEDPLRLSDDTIVTVLAAVNNAVMELEAVRQRRSIEDAAFDNIWRGP